MRVVPMMQAQAIAPLVRYVEAAGGNPVGILGSGVSSAIVGDALIPVADAGIAFERAARSLGESDIGVGLAEQMQPEEIGALGQLALGAQTVGAGLARLVRNASRFNTGQTYWLEAHGEELRLHRSYARALSRGRGTIGEFALVLSLKLFSLAAGPGFRPSRIWFEGDPPAHAERLAALAERSVSFGHAHTTVAFPRQLLALALPRASRPSPVQTGTPLPSPDPVTSLRQGIEALLRRGRVDIRESAALTGQSVRSFQRSLNRAGLRFAELLEEQRFLAARRLLADRERKVIDVAVALGYTDSANFTRAFRRWAGLSPQAFRRATDEALPAH